MVQSSSLSASHPYLFCLTTTYHTILKSIKSCLHSKTPYPAILLLFSSCCCPSPSLYHSFSQKKHWLKLSLSSSLRGCSNLNPVANTPDAKAYQYLDLRFSSRKHQLTLCLANLKSRITWQLIQQTLSSTVQQASHESVVLRGNCQTEILSTKIP